MNDLPLSAENVQARCDVIRRSCHGSTFGILEAVLGHRSDGELIGCVIDDSTAVVHWDRLVNSYRLSSTERAVLHIARGCCTIERHGIRRDHANVVTEAIAETVHGVDHAAHRSAIGRSSADHGP